MKTDNREALCRAAGMIGGASYGASQRVIDALSVAVVLIDAVINDPDEQDRMELKKEKKQ